MKSRLVQVIWVEIFCESVFRQIWEEVVAKRDALELVDLDPW